MGGFLEHILFGPGLAALGMGRKQSWTRFLVYLYALELSRRPRLRQGHAALGCIALRAGLASALLLLAGCGGVERMYDSQLTTATPVDWWHQLEGGTIAEQRPPPPGLGQPYPNLDQVPE
ncbi:MAG: hypothetical protein M3Y41_05760, partial [Pseudomonadota bacterium]|nr:hypothetical protein [Pseudomonadota bacterium]